MDYNSKIAAVKARIAELRKIKESLYKLEERVIAIEKEVGEVDESLPTDEELYTMDESAFKEQILHLIDLDNEAFSLVDEILGPPDGVPGTAGDPKTISFEEVLANMNKGGKGSAS